MLKVAAGWRVTRQRIAHVSVGSFEEEAEKLGHEPKVARLAPDKKVEPDLLQLHRLLVTVFELTAQL